MLIGLNPRPVAKPMTSSTSLCYEFHVCMTFTYMSNNIFAGTKVVMISSRQTFSVFFISLQVVITWAPVVSWLEPKTCCKAQDNIYAYTMKISCFVYVFFSIKQHLCREVQAISLGRQRHDQGYVYLYVELRV